MLLTPTLTFRCPWPCRCRRCKERPCRCPDSLLATSHRRLRRAKPPRPPPSRHWPRCRRKRRLIHFRRRCLTLTTTGPWCTGDGTRRARAPIVSWTQCAPLLLVMWVASLTRSSLHPHIPYKNRNFSPLPHVLIHPPTTTPNRPRHP